MAFFTHLYQNSLKEKLEAVSLAMNIITLRFVMPQHTHRYAAQS